METPSKKFRASKPKVRTGCITCKIRRVKCDETKPHCHRCVSTGRQCDGYLPVPSVPPSVRPGAPSQAHDLALQEHRALEFFYRQTAPGLSGFFGQAFWKGCVLHLSLSEPAIRHAIASLGAMHRDPTSFALQSYNRSIRSLAQKGAAGPGTALLFIVCSIVFTCLEFLRGNVDAAVTHVTSGVNILGMVRRQRNGSQADLPGDRSYSSFESTFLETELAPILSTLSIATSEFDSGPRVHGFFLNPVDADGSFVFSDTFDSIAEARFGLMDLTTALIKARHDHSAAGGSAASEERDRLRGDLENWKLKFDDLVQRQQDSWGRTDRNAANVVRIMYRTTHIGISLCGSTAETAWDAHKADFEDIVSRAEALLSDREPAREPSRCFSAELGLTCPLHMVAWKCRYPRIRRRGLALLLRLPKRDFIFDSEHHHAVFSRILEMEEACLGLPPGALPAEDVLPPKYVRVHHFYSVPKSELGRNVYAVTFLTKPDGLETGWHFETEHLDLDSLQSQREGEGDHVASVCELAKSELRDLPLLNLVRAILVQRAGSDYGVEAASEGHVVPGREEGKV